MSEISTISDEYREICLLCRTCGVYVDAFVPPPLLPALKEGGYEITNCAVFDSLYEPPVLNCDQNGGRPDLAQSLKAHRLDQRRRLRQSALARPRGKGFLADYLT